MTGSTVFRNIRSGKRRAALQDLESISFQMLEEAIKTKAQPALKKSLEEQVNDWKTKVKFVATLKITGSEIKLSVYTDNEIFQYVDKGTPEHTITPTKVKWLKYRTGYVARTAPKPARARNPSGGVSVGPVTYALMTHHPGSEPRDLTGTVAGDFQPEFVRLIENTFRQISRQTQE